MSAELLITVFVILIAVTAFFLFKRKNKSPQREKINSIIQRFEYGRTLNRLTIDELTKYVKLNNCLEATFMEGITFATAIILLEEVESTVFTSEKLSELRNSKEAIPQLEKTLEKIEIHIQHTSDVRTIFDFYFRNKNQNS